ncbi:MAG: hypothetical protein ACF8CQ_05505 [Rhodopirellula sp. JB044]|uniref:hypothetical protein n=1 Tax=Rhodopirellula sp. JB044 TaxID=3342844 RepID=UPI00370ACC61
MSRWPENEIHGQKTVYPTARVFVCPCDVARFPKRRLQRTPKIAEIRVRSSGRTDFWCDVAPSRVINAAQAAAVFGRLLSLSTPFKMIENGAKIASKIGLGLREDSRSQAFVQSISLVRLDGPLSDRKVVSMQGGAAAI